MGLFSSSSKVYTSSQTDNYNTDARVAADGGSVVVRDGHVTITDGGAIEAAQDTAQGAFDLAEGTAKLGAEVAFDALGFVQSNSKEAFDHAAESQDRAYDFASATTRDTLDLIEATQNAAFGYVQNDRDASNDLVTRTIEQQREESAQLGSQILRLGIPAIAILGLIFIMKGNG